MPLREFRQACFKTHLKIITQKVKITDNIMKGSDRSNQSSSLESRGTKTTPSSSFDDPHFIAHRRILYDPVKIEMKHHRQILSVMESFATFETKNEEAYRRLAIHPRLIPGLGMKLVDEAILESIVEDRNAMWQDEFVKGVDQFEIRVPVVTRPPLPPEKGRMKRQSQPVFYWGC
jgi:hypothetical protein